MKAFIESELSAHSGASSLNPFLTGFNGRYSFQHLVGLNGEMGGGFSADYDSVISDDGTNRITLNSTSVEDYDVELDFPPYIDDDVSTPPHPNGIYSWGASNGNITDLDSLVTSFFMLPDTGLALDGEEGVGFGIGENLTGSTLFTDFRQESYTAAWCYYWGEPQSVDKNPFTENFTGYQDGDGVRVNAMESPSGNYNQSWSLTTPDPGGGTHSRSCAIKYFFEAYLVAKRDASLLNSVRDIFRQISTNTQSEGVSLIDQAQVLCNASSSLELISDSTILSTEAYGLIILAKIGFGNRSYDISANQSSIPNDGIPATLYFAVPRLSNTMFTEP